MKKQTFLVFYVFIIFLSSSQPICSKTNSFIILDYKSGIDYTESAIELVTKNGGQIFHVIKPKILMGYIPEDKIENLKGKVGIKEIYQNEISEIKEDRITNLLIKAFNKLLDSEKQKEIISNESSAMRPLLDQRIGRGPMGFRTKTASTNISERFTSEYMIGRISVGIILPEGNGDPQYDWTQVQFNWVTYEIIFGLDWLANKAVQNNVSVCWFYDWHLGVPIDEEPITKDSGVDFTDKDGVISWIGKSMEAIGYGSMDISAVYGYVNDLRIANKTDWGFAMFVANGFIFADDTPAWAMWWNDEHFLWWEIGRKHGGPYLVMCYENGIYYGIEKMWRVCSHEVCHMFMAVDEYDYEDQTACQNSGSCDDKYGYLQIENRNCEHCPEHNPQCIMFHIDSLNLCIYTRHQIGWRDSDGDGPCDPIDPNSEWVAEIEGVWPGDMVKIFALDGDFVKSMMITPDNSVFLPGFSTPHTIWDRTNCWGVKVFPAEVYLGTINNGSPFQIWLQSLDLNVKPIFTDFSITADTLIWKLDQSYSYVRCKIFDSNSNLIAYPIKDKLFGWGDGIYNNIILSELGLEDGENYTAKFFGWDPCGRRSDTTYYSFNFYYPLYEPSYCQGVINGSNMTITIKWSDNNQNEDGYCIYKHINGSYDFESIEVGENVTEYVDSNVFGSEYYTYYVKAFRTSGGHYRYSDCCALEDLKIPPAPPEVLWASCIQIDEPFPEENVARITPGRQTAKTNLVYLGWKPSEKQNPDVPVSYYKVLSISESPYHYCDYGPIHSTTTYICLKENLKYQLLVRAYDINGDSSWYGEDNVYSTTGKYHHPRCREEGLLDDIVQGSEFPDEFQVSQNYPNPFNPQTEIGFNLPQTAQVTLIIYNILGQKVKTLLDKDMDPGYHSVVWDGKDYKGEKVSSGIYFYQIQTKDFVETKKMLLLR